MSKKGIFLKWTLFACALPYSILILPLSCCIQNTHVSMSLQKIPDGIDNIIENCVLGFSSGISMMSCYCCCGCGCKYGPDEFYDINIKSS